MARTHETLGTAEPIDLCEACPEVTRGGCGCGGGGGGGEGGGGEGGGET